MLFLVLLRLPSVPEDERRQLSSLSVPWHPKGWASWLEQNLPHLRRVELTDRPEASPALL